MFCGLLGSTDGAMDMDENCVYNRLFMAFHLVTSDKIILR